MNKGLVMGLAWMIFLLAGAGQGMAGTPAVTVLPSAQVDGEQILLGDVAEILAEDMARSVLASIPLGRAPRPGQVKTLRKSQILSSLRSQMDVAQSATLEIPDLVYVRRSSQGVPDQLIQDYLTDYFSGQFPGRKAVLEQLDLPRPGAYPKGDLSLAEGAQVRLGRDGRFSVTLDLLLDGRREDRLRVSGRIAVYEDLVCARQNLSRDQTVSAADILISSRNIFGLKGTGISRPEDLEAKVLTADVGAGEPILDTFLAPVPLVRKGQVVTLVARKDHLLIQTSGICQEDGFKNSLIQVENLRSGKLVRGMVKKASTVEVIY